VDALVGAVKSSLKKGQMVTLVGFGSFYVGRRAARTGRNPRTGEALEIAAARVPKFRAGKALKEAVN
jgi:DNA-binding protein HU-beta